jgi:hypothetical protein
MTKLYIQTTMIHAWPDAPEDKQEGYHYTDESGEQKWLPKAEFEAQHLEIGNLTDLPVSEKRIEIAHAMLKVEVDALAAIASGPEFPHLTEQEQKLILNDLQNMRACIGSLANRIAFFSLPKPEQPE